MTLYFKLIPLYVFSACAATVFLDDITKKGCLSVNALLLSVYPLTVGGWWYLWQRNVEKHFFEYEPPNRQHGLRCVRSYPHSQNSL